MSRFCHESVVRLALRLSSKFGREKLFYFAVTFFMAFCPIHGRFVSARDVLHPYELAAHLSTILPNGRGRHRRLHQLDVLFYVAGELWGDVVLSLLFWGLANEITRVSEAGIIYPLLGIGANAAQACSGLFMKFVTTQWHPTGVSPENMWCAKLRLFATVVMLCGASIMVCHKYIAIARKDPNSQWRNNARAPRD